MNEEKLFEIMEDIDETYIAEAQEFRNKTKPLSLINHWPAAACFIACIIGALAVYPSIFNQQETVDPSTPVNFVSDTDAWHDANKDEILNQSDIDSNIDSDISHESLLIRIHELQSADHLGLPSVDRLGWIVIGDRIYIQTGVISNEEASDSDTAYEYIGKASSFTGFYQYDNSVEGEVYAISGETDIIHIKLDNGATIILEALSIIFDSACHFKIFGILYFSRSSFDIVG